MAIRTKDINALTSVTLPDGNPEPFSIVFATLDGKRYNIPKVTRTGHKANLKENDSINILDESTRGTKHEKYYMVHLYLIHGYNGVVVKS